MRPGLVIFDCDGVLVDSEPLSLAVLREVVSEAGCTLPEDWAWDRLLGRSISTVIAAIHDDFGFELGEAHLAQIRARLLARFRAELGAIPGVAEVISTLPAPVCVASSSQPERIACSLKVTGLEALFGRHVFSATMVENGKPAPDLFLLAAQEMGVAPEDCVVIEDSIAGIQAAKAAGMRVIGFTGGSHAIPARLPEKVRAERPDAILLAMRDLPATIDALN
ncbi:HAD family hydrolase [Thioclava sp. A2]|uniref:HAD family hydrolase n=1 Tax=Thioclava sp. FCG-A2 TaxID=3080562 RepID=UPI0029543F7E|nr:HAD family hydrolase [Thioclava sp. A2]MDV7270039.1 HAD family hydrolase [Thioclava sp. A2]